MVYATCPVKWKWNKDFGGIIMTDLTPIIGNNLNQLRRQKALSLDKLAELSGVSKAMIGQIERGESNPTVNTLWKIAAGLRVPFGKLIDTGKPTAEIVRMADLEPIQDDDHGTTLYMLFSENQEKRFELFSVVLSPHGVHHADPHEEGSEEYLVLTDGNLDVAVGSETYSLNQGDAIRFQADRPHSYRNTTDREVRFQTILSYS